MWKFRVRNNLRLPLGLGLACLAVGELLDWTLGPPDGPWTIVGALGASTVLVIGAIEVWTRFREGSARYRRRS